MRNHLLLVALVAMMAVTAGNTRSAHAGLILILDDGTGDSAVVNGAGGVALFNGALGNFAVNITTALANPSIGDANTVELDLTSVNVVSVGGGKLTITAYSTGNTGPANPSASFSTSIAGTIFGGTITAQAWYDASNTGNSSVPPSFGLPALSDPAFSPVFTSGTGAYAGTSGHEVAVGSSMFALINQVELSFSDSVSFDMLTKVTDAPVPEPSTLVMATILLGMFGVLWSYKRTTRTAMAA